MSGTEKSPTLPEEASPAAVARLVIYPAGGVARALWLGEASAALFGRSPQDDDVEPNAVYVDVGADAAPVILGRDPTMTQQHCRFRWDPTRRRARVVDLDSSNGTFVQARREHGCWLDDQDVVRMGNTLVVVEVGAPRDGAPVDQSLAAADIEETSRNALDDAAGRHIVVCGESGTGKTALAQRLPADSGAPRPVVHCRCGELDEQQAQVRLFGRALATGEGSAVAEADGGWCLLDDLDQLPMRSQRTLLRLFDDDTIGSWPSGCPFRVRFIATSTLTPRRAVARGQLLEGLLERLDPLVVELPPLRARRVDVVPALRARLGAFGPAGSQADFDHRGFHPNALEALLTSPFRGNLRVLVRLAERLGPESRQVEWYHLSKSMRRSLRRRQAEGVAATQAHYRGPPNDLLEDLWYQVEGDRVKLARKLAKRFPHAKSRANIQNWLERIGLADKQLPRPME